MQRLIALLTVAIGAAMAPVVAAADEFGFARKLARAAAEAAQPVHSIEVVVTGISDGDTAKVELDGKSVRLRLARIDAPEHEQAWGNRSEQSLRELVYKKLVRIEWREVDRNGRPIVTMTVGGMDVSTEQVRRGMAWVWLGVAGLFEVVWAVLLKHTDGFTRLLPSAATVAAMAVSFYCMSRALQSLPIGTVYDPFVCRGLDALIYGLYSGARFIVAGTPSGTARAANRAKMPKRGAPPQ